RESAETTSSGQWAARARATAVFPTAVGPTRTGTLAAAKPALQLLARQLDDRRAAMYVVRREVGREELQQQLTHLALFQVLPGLDGRPAGERCGEVLQPVGPAAEPSACEIGHELLEARARVESRVRGRHRVEHHRAPPECLRL